MKTLRFVAQLHGDNREKQERVGTRAYRCELHIPRRVLSALFTCFGLYRESYATNRQRHAAAIPLLGDRMVVVSCVCSRHKRVDRQVIKKKGKRFTFR